MQNRRQFLNTLLAAGGGLFMSPFSSSPLVAQDLYTGKLLISIQLDGGLDVTSFCDPKINVVGEPEINVWARNNDLQQMGNIRYAPFGGNALFFNKYANDMLVINGVDAQTNSHTVGIVNNWSGRNAEGFPTLTALMAAVKAPELPLAYLNFGGFGSTQGIIRSSRIDSLQQLQNIIFPNSTEGNLDVNQLLSSDWERIKTLHLRNMNARVNQVNLPQGNLANRESFLESISKVDAIKAFGNSISAEDSIQGGRDVTAESFSSLHQQIQVSLLAFQSGVSVAADVVDYGYDTHSLHDEDHEALLSNFTDALDYLWSYAEELGVADRLMVIVGSDFGRTPFYNDRAGKDHWPIGSYLFMERNAPYTNWTYGETDEGHNTQKISPDTLARDDSNGVIIRPAHVHKAMRKYLEIDTNQITQRFAFNNIEDFDFFG